MAKTKIATDQAAEVELIRFREHCTAFTPHRVVEMCLATGHHLNGNADAGGLSRRTVVTERGIAEKTPTMVLKHNASLRIWGQVTGNVRNVFFEDGE